MACLACSTGTFWMVLPRSLGDSLGLVKDGLVVGVGFNEVCMVSVGFCGLI